METKNATATAVVNAVKIEHDHGLRGRAGLARRPSAAGASIGSRGEPNGMVLVSLFGWADGVRQRLEFRERGVEQPGSRRRSKLVPCLAICDRDLVSGGSMALGPWSSGERVGGVSSVSSATGEPDERLCIGGGGDGTHPAQHSFTHAHGARHGEERRGGSWHRGCPRRTQWMRREGGGKGGDGPGMRECRSREVKERAGSRRRSRGWPRLGRKKVPESAVPGFWWRRWK